LGDPLPRQKINTERFLIEVLTLTRAVSKSLVIQWKGISGTALQWFKFYHSGRSFRVSWMVVVSQHLHSNWGATGLSTWISACLPYISDWMKYHHLQLNLAKTELLVALANPTLHHHNIFI